MDTMMSFINSESEQIWSEQALEVSYIFKNNKIISHANLFQRYITKLSEHSDTHSNKKLNFHHHILF